MANGTQSIGNGAAAPRTNPIAALPRDASKEQVQQAIRHLTTYLDRKPSPAEAVRYLGEHSDGLIKIHFETPINAIRNSLPLYISDHAKMNVGTLRKFKDSLAEKLGREPTAYEIDEQVDMPPAYAYKVLRMLKSNPQQNPKPDSYSMNRGRATLAQQSSFQPRITLQFPPIPKKVEPEKVTKPTYTPADVKEWVGSIGRKRSWEKVEAFFNDPVLLTHLVKTVWANKYHTSAPDEVVLMLRKESFQGSFVTHQLTIFPRTEVTPEALHEKHDKSAIVVLRRQADKSFGVTIPVLGPMAVPLFKLALEGNKNGVIKGRVPQRLAVDAVTGRNNASEDLTWDDALKDIHDSAPTLVSMLKVAHMAMNQKAEELSAQVAFVIRNLNGYAALLSLKSWEDAKKTHKNFAAVYYDQKADLSDTLVHIDGSHALDIAIAYLSGLGIIPRVPLQSEKMLVSGTLSRGAPIDRKSQVWEEYLDYISTLGHGLWGRMHTIYQATHIPQKPETLWMLFNQEMVDKVEHLTRLAIADHDISTAIAAIELASVPQGSRIVSLRGTGALDVALRWLRSVGLDIQNSIEIGYVAGMWKYAIKWSGIAKAPTWGDWRAYAGRGGAQVFARMRQLYEYVHMGEGSPADLVVIGLRRGEGDDAQLLNMRVVTVAESVKYLKNRSIMKIQFRRMSDGREVLVKAWGEGAQETADILEPKVASAGGQVFAPDADQMEKESRRFNPQTENFGSTEPVSKLEPFITPAELMSVPQLSFPADMGKLPKLEGFVATDPDAAKKFQTPPSDTIPLNLPESIGDDVSLPDPPLGLVVAGDLALGGAMMAYSVIEAIAAIDVGVTLSMDIFALRPPVFH